MKLNGSTQIESIIMTNTKDKTKISLFERNESKCFFRDNFEYKNYVIQLRLDFADMRDGEPTLDADIWKKPKNKKNRLHNGKWHHTKKIFEEESNKNIYVFEFEDLKLLLTTITEATKDIKNVFHMRRPDKEKQKDSS